MNGNKGYFEVHKDWYISIVYNMESEYADDEIVQSNLDEIFGVENFTKVYITPNK